MNVVSVLKIDEGLSLVPYIDTEEIGRAHV